MQTFMPMIKSFATATKLCDADLRDQLDDCLAILRAVYGETECTTMYMKAWDGYAEALSVYSLAMVHEWRINRGNSSDIWKDISELVAVDQAFAIEQGHSRKLEWPPWVGDFDIHRSHRSVLIARNPGYYGWVWPNTPERMPLLYPQPVRPEADPRGYRLHISPADERRLAAGELQLPYHLEYDVHKREVIKKEL